MTRYIEIDPFPYDDNSSGSIWILTDDPGSVKLTSLDGIDTAQYPSLEYIIRSDWYRQMWEEN